MKASRSSIMLLTGILILTGCRRDMFAQPKANPLQESDFFKDGAASRPLPKHTIAEENRLYDDSFYTGISGTNFVTTFPMALSPEVFRRGRQVYEIDCVPCHGRCGDGDGMVVQRGLPAPASFNSDRLRSAPNGHFVAAIAQGYGIMFSQAAQVAPEDRWAVTAYIRALQLSQHATLADLPSGMATNFTSAP